MLEPIRLRVAGVVAIVNALLAVPMLVLVFIAAGSESRAGDLVMAAIELIGAALVTLLYSTLAALVRHQGGSIGFWTGSYIALSWLGLIPTAIGLALPAWEEMMDWVGIIPGLLAGVALIGIGAKLGRTNAPLFGWRGALSGLHIATGISLVTVICFPVAILAGMISDGLLALVFFRAASSPEEAVVVADPTPRPELPPADNP